MIHEDDRRKLIEFGNGETWKCAKAVFIKKATILGDHYHKLKTECFMLVAGSATATIEGERLFMSIGTPFTVKPHQMHSFELAKGSILIGLMSEEFNAKDDYESKK